MGKIGCAGCAIDITIIKSIVYEDFEAVHMGGLAVQAVHIPLNCQ